MTQQRYRVTPGTPLKGELQVPGDKSISHRALLLNALAQGEAEVTGLLEGEDCLATERALRALGVAIQREGPGHYRIQGVGRQGFQPAPGAIDMGNSGTGIRLLAGITAAQAFDSVLTGDESLLRRPMGRIADPLNLMGADVRTVAGCPPITTKATAALRGIEYQMPIASAQVKSALLLAGLNAAGPTVINAPGPSRDHTERLLAAMGADIHCVENRVSLAGPTDLSCVDIEVPGDFSSAAFFLVAGCLAAPAGLLVRNVGLNPTRTGLLSILNLMGADIRIHNERSVGGEPVADLEARQVDLQGARIPTDLVPLAIDEFPIVFVAAAAAAGETYISGAAELRHKESDRIKVMADALGELGVEIEERADGATIRGGILRGGVVDACGDHRVAMAVAVAGLVAEGPIDIHNTDNVATSFPGFDALARGVGFELEVSGGV
jgi:3-phosphoshikimate 1-carboxyvinyltransferase